MIKFLIGHRGTGKTTLLNRLKKHSLHSTWSFFDLDEETEKFSNQTVSDFFAKNGEEKFRKLEKDSLEKLLSTYPTQNLIISLGAGFLLSKISDILSSLQSSQEIEFIWIQRATDLDGRVFLNRPRLDSTQSPLSEFIDRAQHRNLLYQKYSHYSLVIPEGAHLIKESDHFYFELEKKIVFEKIRTSGGSITVLPEMIQHSHKWSSFLNRYKNSGIECFEVRDDLLEQDQIDKVFKDLSGEKIIFSFRKNIHKAQDFIKTKTGLETLNRADWIDWPFEFGDLDYAKKHLPLSKTILSFHELVDSQINLNFPEFKAIKLSPLLEDWNLIFSFYKWQQQDPNHRIFLPRSLKGRWEWFRLFMRHKQPINFFAESMGSAPDQPNIVTWLMTDQQVHLRKDSFAAILGSPVIQSYTPMEQFNFFKSYQEPVYRIDLKESEFNDHFLNLVHFGLHACAVTSPLKEAAFKKAQVHSKSSKEVCATNTLICSNNQIHGHNTDIDGLRKLFEHLPPESSVAVWGGGGTLEAISQFFRAATFFSSRSGQIKKQFLPLSDPYNPDILIWAAPRRPDTQFPSLHWSPTLVVDLNYTENSMGREYALKINSKYISGESMFLAQAISQREYWRSFYECQSFRKSF